MGAILAVLHKKGGDATEAALAMIKTFVHCSVEAYGIASSSKIAIEKTLHRLQNRKLDAAAVIGYTFSRILEKDKPQPLKTIEATVVFDGRVFPANARHSDAVVFAEKLSASRNIETCAKTFVKRAQGDFAFAIAEAERLVAGRDTLGARPLYYGENAVFAGLASERKALWNIGIDAVNSFPPGHVTTAEEHGFEFKLARRLVFSKPKPMTMKTAAEKLQILLQRAVKERLSGLKEVALAFSGGLDSGIIAYLAKKAKANVQLVHVSLKEKSETEHAERMAAELNLPIRIYTYTEDDVSRVLPMILKIIEEPHPVKASIGIPVYWAAEKTRKAGLKVMLAGQGGDELFAGYRRHVDNYVKSGSKNAREAIFRDIVGMHENNLERDVKICNFHGVELRLPFAEGQIVKFALEIPVQLKIHPSDNTLRKLVLRQAARNLGLPQAIANRPKKAMQYGTGVSNTLNKIAKQKHLTLKDYVQRTFQAQKWITPDA